MDWFPLLAGILPTWFYFLTISAGHIAIVVFFLNRIYSIPFSRWTLKLLKYSSVVLALAGPVFLYLNGFGEFPYWGICFAVGFCLPVLWLGRVLQPPPHVQITNHTKTIDVARQLGHLPLGRGKLRHLARLPGNQVFHVDFTEKTFHLPQLPAEWDGLTILHLTDLHFKGCPDKEFFQHVMDQCREPVPDLVAVTGDIVDSWKHHRWVAPVLGRLRWKVAGFAILGNHDFWHDPRLTRRRLKRIGLRVLDNRWEQIEVRGQPMVVIGHEGPWFTPAPDLAGCPDGVFRLLLTHTPDNIDWAKRHQVGLALAGHNHGGQVRIPLIGSVFVPSSYGRRYDCGTFHEPPTLMHVGRGLAGQEPIRYFCKPEVTRIVLRTR